MRIDIYVAFSYASNHRRVDSVFAYSLSTHSEPDITVTTQGLYRIPRDGTGSDQRVGLMTGLVRLIEAQPHLVQTAVHVHTYEDFLASGLQGLMFAWNNNDWQLFGELGEVRYRPQWESLREMVINGRVRFQATRVANPNPEIQRLKILAQAEKDRLVAQLLAGS